MEYWKDGNQIGIGIYINEDKRKNQAKRPKMALGAKFSQPNSCFWGLS